ncbi:MAG: Gfo/Idh/MocA family oxidoreductase [Calditrichae bacterium]|nr:Gfo/Idh/MocA family oxidoreductase [Calditrichota bacterium]MCB9058430.1 Gfo/Idh/MocA family oxidoreductase [Calditrichia bacterium]
MINVGVIGVGYWGPNIIRNFYAHPKTNVVKCSDLRDERLAYVKKTYPVIETTKDANDVINDPRIDLIAIITPVYTHYELAKRCLEAGKHVLIEKPMTSNSADSERLIELAKSKNLQIFVDHTFVFTGAVAKIKETISSGELGDLFYFDSVRVNLGLFQHDINVLWDLAPHDISIMQTLLNLKPESVVATGSDHLKNGIENIAYLSVYYPDNVIGHIHANWLSPVKVRQTLIAGTKKMIVWDDIEPTEKIRIYDKGIDVIETANQVYDMLIQYRTGDMYCPKINSAEALTVEVDNIVACLEENQKSLANGEDGLMVVKILEAAEKSLKNRGQEVKI